MKHKTFTAYWFLLFTWTLSVEAATEGSLGAAMVNPGSEEKPDWFKVSFLDLYEDIDEATDANKRVLLYFFQDGCPYCKVMLEQNFGQRSIAEKTQKYFDVIAINIWGDREMVIDDKTMTEKQFAEALRVQYTPTLIAFGEDRKAVFRANGYYSPEKFSVVLDYVGQKKERETSFQDYLAKVAPQPASGKLYSDIATIKTPDNLSKALIKGRHLLVFFEQKQCKECDELHTDVLDRPLSRKELSKFDIAFLDMWSNDSLVTPKGKKTTVRKFAKEKKINYAPSMVYFDDKGDEVFRSDGYLRSFHIQSALDYVSSGAYRKQKNFQRYIEDRAARIRDRGTKIDLMN